MNNKNVRLSLSSLLLKLFSVAYALSSAFWTILIFRTLMWNVASISSITSYGIISFAVLFILIAVLLFTSVSGLVLAFGKKPMRCLKIACFICITVSVVLFILIPVQVYIIDMYILLNPIINTKAWSVLQYLFSAKAHIIITAVNAVLIMYKNIRRVEI